MIDCQLFESLFFMPRFLIPASKILRGYFFCNFAAAFVQQERILN